MGVVFNNRKIAPGTVWGKNVREWDWSAFFPGLGIRSMKLLGYFRGSGEDSLKGVDSSRLPISRGFAKKRQGCILVNAKLDSLELRSTEVKLGKLPNTEGFAELVVPPASGATGEREGRESIGTSETPGGGPGPAKALGFLPSQTDDATRAGDGINEDSIKDHDFLPDPCKGRPKARMAREKTARSVDTEV